MTVHQGPRPPNLELDTIAAHLEGLEETIIARLIDRAQFRVNERIYQPGESGFAGEPAQSLFHVRLRFQERMDAQFGRFCVPEERPFFRRLPKPRRRMALPDTGLRIDDVNLVNVMAAIAERYLELIPRICAPGDDGHYGSSVEHDVYAMQAIGRRVHYGALYVTESKFRDSPDEFAALAAAGDRERIIARLTREEVENRIVERTREKVITAQLKVNPNVRHCIDPGVIAEFYKTAIVPLTKKGEVLYLMNRMK